MKSPEGLWLSLQRKPALYEFPKIAVFARFVCLRLPHAVGENGMKRLLSFSLGRQFFTRSYSSSPSSSSTSHTLFNRVKSHFPSQPAWTKAWRYFLWFPAVVFINDHVVSISPVNGISMRPTVFIEYAGLN